MNTLERLDKIERKIEQAARELQPVVIGGMTATRAAIRAHDALNDLAAAMLEVGLLKMEHETEGARA